MIEIPVADASLGEEEALAVAEVVRSGWLSKGQKVDEFEKRFAAYTGAAEAIAVNNGTSALHVALAVLGVGPGDEVIVPSLTFISTANVVIYQGATPVLCECDPDTYNVTADTIREKITPRTKAVIPVEMNGLPIDYDEVLAVCSRAGLPVIVDSAESLGSVYRGSNIGAIAPVHCFSFFPNKIITTGEGGMITVSDPAMAQRMRQILNQGQDGRYHHVVLGYNYRMAEMQAAIGLVQLSKIGVMLAEKTRIADRYAHAFSSMAGVTTPHVPGYVDRHSWYMYAISVDREHRDRIVTGLDERGIATRLSFPPIHGQPLYAERFGYVVDDLPVTWNAWSRLINIPIWPGMGEETQDRVISALRELGSGS